MYIMYVRLTVITVSVETILFLSFKYYFIFS